MLERLVLLSLILTALVGAGAEPAVAAARPIRIAFVAPLSGPLESAMREILAGAESGARYRSGRADIGRREIEIVPVDSSKGAGATEKALTKLKPLSIVAASGGEGVAATARIARKKRIPCIVASIWAPPFEATPTDPVFHLAGNAVDHAVAAVGTCRVPMGAKKVAAIHDGTPGAENLAAAFLRNLSPDLTSAGAHAAGSRDAMGPHLEKLEAAGVDAVFVCGDVPLAIRVARAAAKVSGPKLLFADGCLGDDLARVVVGDARFLCGTTPDLDEGAPSRYRITRTDKDLAPSPMGVRGYGAVSTLMDALALAKGKARAMVSALRALDHPKWGRVSRFGAWGQSRVFEYELYDMAGEGPAPVRRTYLPSAGGGVLLAHRTPSSFRADPDTRIVRVTWGKSPKRTIDDDLKRIGLFTAGYEGALDQRARDDVMARVLAWLNRHFRRNVDGTAIPNVSYGITFTAAPPEDVPGRNHWIVRIAGDDPSAGGRAMNPYALVYSTFIVRTAYLRQALHPALQRKDLDYFTREYAWGTTADENVRNDEIRCLIEGVAGAFGLTAAHEIGHLAGLGHDTTSPRSIMNVEEGAGLDPAWAEWVPAHRKILRSRLKILDSRKGRRRK